MAPRGPPEAPACGHGTWLVAELLLWQPKHASRHHDGLHEHGDVPYCFGAAAMTEAPNW